MVKISDKFLSGGRNPFMDLVAQKEFSDLVKFGMKPEYLNSLPDRKALGDRWKKYIIGKKSRGGYVAPKKKYGIVNNLKKKK